MHVGRVIVGEFLFFRVLVWFPSKSNLFSKKGMKFRRFIKWRLNGESVEFFRGNICNGLVFLLLFFYLKGIEISGERPHKGLILRTPSF